MYKEVLSGIEGIGIYPVISFVVFFLFFLGMTVWIFRSKSSDFEEVSMTPLADNGNTTSVNKNNF